jgi:DNA polymerase-3 subunit gamma/tau
MYQVLYRKWRPQTFSDVVGQDVITATLKNELKSGRLAHAYLFTGSRGTGKTTCAKILAKAANCMHPVDGDPCNECDICKGILNDSLLDVSEIDAASNNGVDNIRAIIEESSYSASKAQYKVFIIDEVHMLTQQAFNALLKTLEEPPENVVFILATTEPHKLPVTILSRCQRYDFKRISRDGITERLDEICKSLGIEYEESALKFIAGKADGALRDAISILDQTLASINGKLTLADARASSGSLDRETVELFAEKLILNDGATVLTLTDKIFTDGRDPSNFICELIDIFRSMMVVLSVRNPGSLIVETGEDLERLKNLANLTNLKELTLLIKELSSLENSLKWSVQRKIVFEAGMLAICDRTWGSEAELTERVKYLEQHVADLVANGLKVAAINAPSGTGMTVSATSFTDGNAESSEEINDNAQKDVDNDEPVLNHDKSFALSQLTPVEELDWKDFLGALSDKKKPGIANSIKLNSKGYVIGNTLYIVFNSATMMNIVTKNDPRPLLKECALSAFGKKLNVSIEKKDDFEAMVPELKAQAEAEGSDEEQEQNSAFEHSVDLLKKLSEENGFSVSEEKESEPYIDHSLFDDPLPAEEEDLWIKSRNEQKEAEKVSSQNNAIAYEFDDNDIPPEDYDAPNVPPDEF